MKNYTTKYDNWQFHANKLNRTSRWARWQIWTCSPRYPPSKARSTGCESVTTLSWIATSQPSNRKFKIEFSYFSRKTTWYRCHSSIHLPESTVKPSKWSTVRYKKLLTWQTTVLLALQNRSKHSPRQSKTTSFSRPILVVFSSTPCKR